MTMVESSGANIRLDLNCFAVGIGVLLESVSIGLIDLSSNQYHGGGNCMTWPKRIFGDTRSIESTK